MFTVNLRFRSLFSGDPLICRAIKNASDSALYYSYSIGGVQYEASQDVTALRHLLPPEPERLIGLASLKYAPRNPANSILICERWSGLRISGSQVGSSPTLKDS